MKAIRQKNGILMPKQHQQTCQPRIWYIGNNIFQNWKNKDRLKHLPPPTSHPQTHQTPGGPKKEEQQRKVFKPEGKKIPDGSIEVQK